MLWLATYKSSNEQLASAQQKIRWLELLRYRQVWAIVVARFITDPVWWLYITWLPLYLFNVRGFSLQQIGMFAWLPYVAADAGSLSGGWMSGHLIARGWGEDKARKTVIVAGALVRALPGVPAGSPVSVTVNVNESVTSPTAKVSRYVSVGAPVNYWPTWTAWPLASSSTPCVGSDVIVKIKFASGVSKSLP